MAGGANVTGTTDFPDKFELLLEMFPHPERRHLDDPEKRKWRMSEIEDATREEVSSSWLSALRKKKTGKPGMRMLDLIAQTLGFPFELWLTEPEQWERLLRERGFTQHDGCALPRGTADYEQWRSVAELLGRLIASITNRRTGLPFTSAEIAAQSDGRLTESDVEAMLAGELENPSRMQLLALCDVFNVDLSYFFGEGVMPMLTGAEREALRKVQESNNHMMLLRKSLGLEEEQLRVLLLLVEQIQPAGVRSKNDELCTRK